MFWSKLLLEHFKNSAFSEPPADLFTRNFHREVETVVKFSQRVSSQPSTPHRDLQKVLLLGLADTKVGLYSIFHDNAVYKLGYASEEAVRMAYM
jgi:RNA-dependent RNA polymerase